MAQVMVLSVGIDGHRTERDRLEPRGLDNADISRELQNDKENGK